MLCLALANFWVSARADEFYPSMRQQVQMGVDVWHISPSNASRYLALPNATVWTYRPVSPWVTVDGSVWLSNQLAMNLRARADQGLGTHVEELNASWAISPKLGVNAGVVSYKTTWCRTYEADSPWVRESNPFCTVSTTSDSVGGAPGLEVYTKFSVANYLLQAQMGVYRPLVFNYNTTEFSTAPYPNASVYKNSKTGFSMSALNLDTASELRFGFLHTKQAEHVGATSLAESFDNQQIYDVIFVGGSFYLAPSVYLRAQTMRHNMTASYWSEPWSNWPSYRGGVDLLRSSNALEIGYRQSSKDVMAMSVSEYLYDNSFVATLYPLAGYNRYPHQFVYRNKSISASWRHDWDAHFFTSLQLTRSAFRSQTPSANNIDPSTYRNERGYSVGVRLGYQFD